MREPWWRKQNGHWYIEVFGKQVRISKEPDWDGDKRKHPPIAVQNEWHRIEREGSPADMQAGDLFSLYVASLPAESENHKTSKRQLAAFESFIGKEKKVSSLIPHDLTKYLQTKPHWRPSSIRTTVNRIHAALNWGVREGLLSENPISSVKGYRREGRNERRRGVLSEADRQAADENSSPEFRAVLTALRETGARPSEICRAQIEKVFLEDDYMLVPNKTAHQTGEAERKIYLSPVMRELIAERIDGRTSGPVFVNSKGRPWTLHSLKKRWETLRAKTGIKGSLRSYRRTFISTAINSANVNPALVAQLAGHSIDVMMKHYFESDPQAMLAAVAQITGHKSAPIRGRRQRRVG